MHVTFYHQGFCLALIMSCMELKHIITQMFGICFSFSLVFGIVFNTRKLWSALSINLFVSKSHTMTPLMK